MVELEPKYKKIYNQVRKLLRDKGVLEKADDNLINELSYQFSIIDKSKIKIDELGVLVNVRGKDNNPYFQPNPAISIYNQALKMVATLSTKLGITVQERSKLKLNVEKDDDDGFDD